MERNYYPIPQDNQSANEPAPNYPPSKINDLNWGNVGGIDKPDDNATVGATAGTDLKDSGATVLGDADVITSQGTAALIAGQGALATIDQVDTAEIVDLAVQTAKLDDLSVATGKIAGLAVTTAKIDNLAITNAKIDNLAVDNAKIADLAVDKLTAGIITSKALELAVSAGTGDSYLAGKTALAIYDWLNWEVDGGFMLGLDDSDGDKAKFFVGNKTEYVKWDGSGLKIKSNTSNLKLYDTVVDAAGNGDYTSLSAAVTAGKTKIFIRDGNYSNTSITLLSDMFIIGESASGVVLDVNLTFEGGNITTQNTITATNASTIITGSATTWIGIVQANDILIVDEQYYYVSSVDSDTQITLKEKFYGTGGASLSYRIIRPKSNLHIENVTLKNSSGRVLIFNYTDKITIRDCIIKTTGSISDGHFYSSIGYNFEFSFIRNTFEYASAGGLWIVAHNFKINENNFKHTGYGNTTGYLYSISIDSGCRYGEVKDNVFSPVENEGTGLAIYINISGNYNVVTGNKIDGGNKGYFGISTIFGGLNNIISNNIIRRCVGAGIYITSANYETVVGNSVTECGIGIELTATSDYCVVTNNQLHGNTTAITDNGSNTINVNNQTL